MTPTEYRVRRATLDDLPALRELWRNAALPPGDLEKHFTEVQLAETPEGQIAAAIGFRVERLHGKIHSEAILDPNDTRLHEAFWRRVQVLARNHGLFRLWTESLNPFWGTIGFMVADEKALEKAPATFVAGTGQALTLALKDELKEGLSVEQQFEIFSQAQKAETDRLIQQAQVFKKVVYAVIFLITGGFILYAAVRFLNRPRRTRR